MTAQADNSSKRRIMPLFSFYSWGLLMALAMSMSMTTANSQPLQGAGQTRVRLSDGPQGEPRVQIDSGDVTDVPHGSGAAPVRGNGITVSSATGSPGTLVIT